jgi:hypothetical protein
MKCWVGDFNLKLKRRSENRMSDMDIIDEVGANPTELEDFLDNIGKRIEKTKDTVINEIIHIAGNENEPKKVKKENKRVRSLKKKS